MFKTVSNINFITIVVVVQLAEWSLAIPEDPGYIQYTVPGFEPQPLELESPPITTRPGLLTILHFILNHLKS